MEMIALLALLLIAGRRDTPTTQQATGRVNARDQFLSSGVGVSASLSAAKIRSAPVIVGRGTETGSAGGMTSSSTAQGSNGGELVDGFKRVLDAGLDAYNEYSRSSGSNKDSSSPQSYGSSKYSGASNDGGYNTKRK